jgi:hypothetical protein
MRSVPAPGLGSIRPSITERRASRIAASWKKGLPPAGVEKRGLSSTTRRHLGAIVIADPLRPVEWIQPIRG